MKFKSFSSLNSRVILSSEGKKIPDKLILFILTVSVKKVLIVAKENAPNPIKQLSLLVMNFLNIFCAS